MTVGVFSLVSCRQGDEVEASIPNQMKTTKSLNTTLQNSTTDNQTVVEEDPPVKTPIKW